MHGERLPGAERSGVGHVVEKQLAVEMVDLVGERARGDARDLAVDRIALAVEGFDPERGVRFESYCELRVKGALLEVRDQLTGRALGELVVPGLDEYVDWSVATGAFLLAEETRATVFEIPD